MNGQALDLTQFSSASVPPSLPPDQAELKLGEPSLADLRERIGADDALPPATRAQWRSALKRIGIWLGRDLSLLPARVGALRQGLIRLNPAALGISRKRLRSALADLKAALRYAGTLPDYGGRGVRLVPEWQVLYDRLPTPRLKRGLVRLFRYCSARRITPEEVGDNVIDDFIADVVATTFIKKPKDLHRQVCRLWNVASDTVDYWPVSTLLVPNYRPAKESLDWEDLPESFRDDAERYLAWLGGEDILADNERVRACMPSTVERRREYLRLAVSMAVREGARLEALTSLAALVTPTVVRQVLEGYLRKSNQRPTQFIIHMAERLRAIAKGWSKLAEEETRVLDLYCRRLAKDRKTGLTDKNSAVIRRLRDPDTRRRFLALPRLLVERAIKETEALHKAAVTMQMAVAIQILQVAPMRIANLTALKIGVNVLQVGQSYHIAIPDHDVKNRIALEYPLPEQVSDMLALYLTAYRPRLKGADGPWLFPGQHGYKAKRTLSEQITERVAVELGFEITPHQYRHVAAALILMANPGNFELVRRVLGHKNLATTVRFYIELENTAAAQQFAELIMREVEDDVLEA